MPPPRHLSHGGVITVPGSYGFVVAVENKSVQGLVIKSPAYPYYTLPACKSHSKPETFLPMVLQGSVQETVSSVLKVEADSLQSVGQSGQMEVVGGAHICHNSVPVFSGQF